MGLGEGKDHDEPQTPRHLYRQGSLSSQFAEELGLPLDGFTKRDSVASSKCSRARTNSGKSIRSRTASRVEYHEDLKPSLRHGLTKNLLIMAFVILMGSSFVFGYNIGVLNQPDALIGDFYNRTYSNRSGEALQSGTITFLSSLTTALFLPGGMIGAFSAGYLADKVGRKKAVLLSHIPGIIGAILSSLCVIAKSPELLLVGRFFTGINCGFATQLAPMYLLEVTPYNLKGAFGTANQLFITIGIFMGSLFGLREILGTVTEWPYLLLLNLVPIAFSIIVLPFLHDSPRFLMLVKKDRIAAEKALRWLRDELDVTADIEEMETEAQDMELTMGKNEEYTMKQLLTTKELRMPLLVAISLQMIQQLSGINAIFFYSKKIYDGANVAAASIQYAVMGTNAVNVAMTLIAVPVMDIAGRRPLLLYPMAVMVVIMAIITAALNLQATYSWMSYISIICVVGYVICFAIGLGPIPMMIGAELFRQGPRPRAMSLAGLANWLFTLVVALSFPAIQEQLQEFTFIIFLVLMFFFTIFIFIKVPETKNKTFEEIASVFQPGTMIEVEEIVEDEVFQESKADEDNAAAPMLGGQTARNGSVASDKGSKLSLQDISMKPNGKSEEKRSLTKSAENIGNLEV